jgi:hypothetical protein
MSQIQKPENIKMSQITGFGAAFRIRREGLRITKAERRDAVMLHSVPNRPFSSHRMWVSPAVCVSLRFKAFQQFGDNWREFGEKNFSLKTPERRCAMAKKDNRHCFQCTNLFPLLLL